METSTIVPLCGMHGTTLEGELKVVRNDTGSWDLDTSEMTCPKRGAYVETGQPAGSPEDECQTTWWLTAIKD
jgi:hypothetical protein